MKIDLDRFVSELHTQGQARAKTSSFSTEHVTRIFGTPDEILEETNKIAGHMEKYLDPFVGTQLYDQALALCEEEMKLQAEDMQRRQARHAEQAPMEDSWLKQDMLRLQKEQLELQLHKFKAQGQQAGAAPAASEQVPAVPVAEAAPMGGASAAAAPAAKFASLRGSMGRLKAAMYGGSYLKASSDDCEPSFLDRFVGTPLYEQAAALEQESIALAEENLARRAKEIEQNKTPDASYLQREQIQLQKQKLELQLHGLKSQQSEGPALAAAAPKTAAFLASFEADKTASLGQLAAQIKPSPIAGLRREIPKALELSAARRSIPAQLAGKAGGAARAVPPPIPDAAHDVFRSPRALAFGKNQSRGVRTPDKVIPHHQQPKEMQQHAEGLHMLSERAAKGDPTTRANTLNLAKRMGVHGDVSASVLAHDKGLSKFARLMLEQNPQLRAKVAASRKRFG